MNDGEIRKWLELIHDGRPCWVPVDERTTKRLNTVVAPGREHIASLLFHEWLHDRYRYNCPSEIALTETEGIKRE